MKKKLLYLNKKGINPILRPCDFKNTYSILNNIVILMVMTNSATAYFMKSNITQIRRNMHTILCSLYIIYT